ncbi:glutaredoxin 3 [Faunimonas pinastri]|uniref:Glutaredoxin 1 n=2 Tax=Faunimonas pinastri TaxID=1855383 RepID=A0A1H9MWR0_9HYPH|nr:glutaredoxin 3 [Faunimonas pinastri]
MANFRVYGFETCPFCKRALNMLLLDGATIDYVKLPTLEERTAWMDERGFVDGDRTFPKVYLVDKEQEVLIGGSDALELYLHTQRAIDEQIAA